MTHCHCFLTLFPWSRVGPLPWKTNLDKLLPQPFPMGYSCSQADAKWDPSMVYSLLQCGSFISSEVLPANQYGLLLMGTQVLAGTFPSAGFQQGHSLSGTHTPGSTACSSMVCRWISAPLGPPWAGFKYDSGITIYLHVPFQLRQNSLSS